MTAAALLGAARAHRPRTLRECVASCVCSAGLRLALQCGCSPCHSPHGARPTCDCMQGRGRQGGRTRMQAPASSLRCAPQCCQQRGIARHPSGARTSRSARRGAAAAKQAERVTSSSLAPGTALIATPQRSSQGWGDACLHALPAPVGMENIVSGFRAWQGSPAGQGHRRQALAMCSAAPGSQTGAPGAACALPAAAQPQCMLARPGTPAGRRWRGPCAWLYALAARSVCEPCARHWQV